MYQKKTDEIISEFAIENDIDKTVVSDIVNAYYKLVKEELENLDNLRVNVVHIGTFKVRKKKLDWLINKLSNEKGFRKKGTPLKNMIHMEIAESIDKLELLSQKYLDALRKRTILKSKDNGDLEE
jgi:nucleoid DNA-binding protein